jgi:hypothetical protein
VISSPVDFVSPVLLLVPQAARAKTIASASKMAKNFFIVDSSI